MTPFPPFHNGRHVERAIIETCLRWGETWIAEVERQNEIPPRSLPVPERGQFTTRSREFLKYPEDQTPAVLVIAPGLTAPPRREADRSLTAPVGFALGVITSSGIGDGSARETAMLIASAYSQVLLVHPIEGIDVGGLELLDERYDDIEVEDERIMGAARLLFSIEVRNWRSTERGPVNRVEPPADPYAPPPEWPTLERTRVTVRREGEG